MAEPKRKVTPSKREQEEAAAARERARHRAAEEALPRKSGPGKKGSAGSG
jgi:hypothetical protein